MRGWIKKGIDAYLDFKSFKTDRQLVIIESDDWGSLRTKNKEILNKLNSISSAVKKDNFTQLDSIATAEDLQTMFEVLQSVKNKVGNPACFTANVCTANPDFKTIKASNFEDFFFVPFTETLKAYSANQDLFSLWKEGKNNQVFKPQLHGREHLHALAWLAELRAGNKDLLKAFELDTWGIPYTAVLKQHRKNLQAALDHYGVNGEAEYHKKWIEDSAAIFKTAFGYSANSFIAPAYTWHHNIHRHLANAHIKTLQGIKLQYEPKHKNKTNYNRKVHFNGQIDNPSGLVYYPRNVFFEPASHPNKDWVSFTLKGIEKAFKNKEPAIISSHRINFIGRLDVQHRDKNLSMLKEILKQIVKNYPYVEFIDSGQLANILSIKSN